MCQETFHFASKDGMSLQGTFECPPKAKAAVGIVHGYGDHQGRYGSFRQHCKEQGLATLAFDYRGHGLSAGRRFSCGRWQDYLDDLTAFWQQARQRCRGLPLFLLGYSHGGLMVSVFASQAPEDFKGMVLLAPFWKPGTPVPNWRRALLQGLNGLCPHMLLNTGVGLEQLSHDMVWQKTTAADKLCGRKLTPRWFVETQRMQVTLPEVAASVAAPCLLLVGKEDTVAAPAQMQLFFEKLKCTDKTVHVFERMRHELWAEQDKQTVFRYISEWILSRL